MEQNKGFWFADWSFPIFVGLLSSGVFAGTHMYYLYGIGAFNEVAFVAMLKAGIDTGSYGAVARLVPASCSPALSKAPGGGFWISAVRFRPALVWGFRRCCWAQALCSRLRTLSLLSLRGWRLARRLVTSLSGA